MNITENFKKKIMLPTAGERSELRALMYEKTKINPALRNLIYKIALKSGEKGYRKRL